MTSFKAQIAKYISRNQLIQAGDRILAGVSGGPDSIALLYVLNQLRTEIGFHLHAAHINHQLRKSADMDQKFVEKFCTDHNIPHTAKDIHLEKRIKQGGSVEEIAREERYKALAVIAKSTRSNVIALGHNRDDLAETVLLRVLRGTGLQGLQAILPKRMINGCLIIRPLLDIRRVDIEAYLKISKLTFRTDPTNNQTHFFRNKIRLKLMPLLKSKYQNNINEVLSNLAATAGEDYQYIHQETLKLMPKLIQKNAMTGTVVFNLNQLRHSPNAIKRMALRLAIEEVKGDTLALTLAHLTELEDLILNRPAGSVVDLPHNAKAVKTKTSIMIK